MLATAIAPAPPEPALPAAEAVLAEQKQAALPAVGEVRQLFSQLQVRRGQSGSMVIEAPPEAASTLKRPFRGHGRLASIRVTTGGLRRSISEGSGDA